MENKSNKPEKPKEKLPPKETLEGEIKEAIEKEKEHVEEAKKIAEEQEKVEEIKKETQPYKKVETQESKYSPEKKLQTEPKESQEFYIKNDEDFDKIKNTIQEMKSQDPTISKVQDSDLYEIDPTTKKLKIKSMSKHILEKLKSKRINLDFYNM